jgi:hypothetical protein
LGRPDGYPKAGQGTHPQVSTVADGRGFLDHQVFEDRQLVLIDELTWLGD